MTMTQLEVYLSSGIIMMGTVGFVLYYWLRETILFKVKSFFCRGTGQLYLSKARSFTVRYSNLNPSSKISYKGKDYTIDTQVPTFKFLGINCLTFVEDIPKNLDFLQGEDKYIGVRQDDIDSHLTNLVKPKIIDWLWKMRNIIQICAIVVAVGIVVLAIVSGWNLKLTKELVEGGLKVAAETLVSPK